MNSTEIKLIKDAAVLFSNGLSNRDVLILYKNNNTPYLDGYMFKVFDYNFFHLLGLEYSSDKYKKLKAKDANRLFLTDVLNGRLGADDIILKHNSLKKMNVAKEALSMNNVRLYGDFIYNGDKLQASYAIGNSLFSLATESFKKYASKTDNILPLGFINYYFPISLLAQRIEITSHPTHTIYAILTKEFKQYSYNKCIYYTKEFKDNINTISISPNYASRVSRTRMQYLRIR